MFSDYLRRIAGLIDALLQLPLQLQHLNGRIASVSEAFYNESGAITSRLSNAEIQTSSNAEKIRKLEKLEARTRDFASSVRDDIDGFEKRIIALENDTKNRLACLEEATRDHSGAIKNLSATVVKAITTEEIENEPVCRTPTGVPSRKAL